MAIWHSAAHTVPTILLHLCKGLHKHIDIGPPSCFGGSCHIREKTMEEIKPAIEQQRLSAMNLFAIAQRKIDEATRRGAASVQIILPTGYDDEAVEDLICYLRTWQYYVKWYHGTDCLEISWKWDDVMNSKKQ